MPTWKTVANDLRKFIRHPSCVPISIDVDDDTHNPGSRSGAGRAPTRSINVSSGGLAFQLGRPVAIGSRLTISMPEVWPDYFASGRVVWCREAMSGFEAGVEFNETNEAFKARMVAQFCQIEDYRQDVLRTEGRELSSEDAAREWIMRYAAEFADTMGLH